MKLYDVWVCFTNGRTSYRATDAKEPFRPYGWKPDWATSHLDTVEAPNKRRAISLAVKAAKDFEK